MVHGLERRFGIPKTTICIVGFLLVGVWAQATAETAEEAVYWNQFRGPNGQGRMAGARIPTRFDPQTNVRWKTAVPEGISSPVIWGDRIYLTAWERGEEQDLVTLAVDRGNGRIVWRAGVKSLERVRVHAMNHRASPTPAVDADHVYAYFGGYGLICYDHDGGMVWERKIEPTANRYGAASSPILHGRMVILVLDNDAGRSRILAVDRDAGRTVWEQPRSMFSAGWSTPMIWRHGDTEELVVLGAKRLTSYDPATGRELWWAGGYSPETVGVPVAGEGLVFVSAAALAGRGDMEMDVGRMWRITIEEFDRNGDGRIQREEMTERFTVPIRPDLARDNPGYGWPIRDMDGLLRFFDKDRDRVITEQEWTRTMEGFSRISQPQLLAIRPGARGNARPGHVAWEHHEGIPEIPSLLYHEGRLYMIRDAGVLTCLEAKTGRPLYREKIGAAGQYVASPVAAGDRIVVASLRGVVTVIQAGDMLNILAQNAIKERIYATPALGPTAIYLRTDKHLYAFGE